VFCLVAFVLRDHGEKIPACKDLNSTISNATESLTYFTIATLESNSSSEFDSPSSGFTDDPGTN
jgi:hypothetical protein